MRFISFFLVILVLNYRDFKKKISVDSDTLSLIENTKFIEMMSMKNLRYFANLFLFSPSTLYYFKFCTTLVELYYHHFVLKIKN